VKQSGALLGGGAAGLLAPLAAAWGGWPAALLLGVVAAALASAAIQPLRRALDAERNPAARISPRVLFGWPTSRRPCGHCGRNPLLWPITLLGVAFAVGQGCLFTFAVSWLVQRHGLSMAAAGLAFTTMQAAGMAARILLAMLTDRIGRAARNLVAQAFGAAGAIAALALLPPGSPYWQLLALAGLCGFLGASWNGITLAEVARLVPPARVAEATSGSTLVIFCGYTAGPAAFAAFVGAAGSWEAALLLVAAHSPWPARRRDMSCCG
jgi:predicted MFS family arabinose efflux permease